MNIESKDWTKNKEAGVAKIIRSISQDVGKNFRDNTLRKLFPRKVIKDKDTGEEVDIGLKCCDWLYRLLTEFRPEKKQLDAIIFILIKSYRVGYDFEKNKKFLDYFIFNIARTFSKKIQNFSQISKLSFMDDLDRKPKSFKSRDGDEIQW